MILNQYAKSVIFCIISMYLLGCQTFRDGSSFNKGEEQLLEGRTEELPREDDVEAIVANLWDSEVGSRTILSHCCEVAEEFEKPEDYRELYYIKRFWRESLQGGRSPYHSFLNVVIQIRSDRKNMLGLLRKNGAEIFLLRFGKEEGVRKRWELYRVMHANDYTGWPEY